MTRAKFLALLILMGIVMIVFAYFFLMPSHADYDDHIAEDIGGDNFLVVNLNQSLKIKEENIPEGVFDASKGSYNYYDAKNIFFIDYRGNRGYMIAWKTSPDNYTVFDTGENVNQYLSDYSMSNGDKCFIEYSYENNAIYGIIIGGPNIEFSESELMYGILGLNNQGFDLTYSNTVLNDDHSSSSSGYHTVVPDRHSLSRSDPGSYYDHYEYGDNYEIDDYLESQGYD